MEIIYTISEIQETAKKVIENTNSKIILFYGEMGSGKTTLIKEIAKQLGVQDSVSSPTFSLVNEYETPNSVIFHFDFYRIDDENEALDMGVTEYFEKNAWIFIEWPQKIEKIMPDKVQKLEISRLENDHRMLKFC